MRKLMIGGVLLVLGSVGVSAHPSFGPGYGPPAPAYGHYGPARPRFYGPPPPYVAYPPRHHGWFRWGPGRHHGW